MALELSVDAVREFIALNEGKVKNTILVAHFRKFLNDPHSKTEARQKFKDCVNTVAVVKTENGEKYVQLKKKFRTTAPMTASALAPDIPESHSTQASPNHISSFDNPIEPEPEIPILYTAQTDNCMPEAEQELTFPSPSNDTAQFGEPSEPSFPQRFEPPMIVNGANMETKPSTSSHQHTEADTLPMQVDPTIPKSKSGASISSDEPDNRSDQGTTDPSGQFRVPRPPGKKKHEKGEPKENVPPPSVVLTAPKSRGYSLSANSTPDLNRRPRPLSFVQPTGAVERARQTFQGKKSEAEETSSITQSERSVDSNKDPDHEYDDDRQAAPFAMDPLEKQWMLQAARGNMVELRKLLNQDPNLAEKKDFMMGYTALHWAAKKGNLDLVKMFGDAGVDVNVKSNGGYTPLHLAAMHGHEKVVQVLVDEYEADTITRDYTGKQARDYLRTGSISLPIQSKQSRRSRSSQSNYNNNNGTITMFGSKSSFYLSQKAFYLPRVSKSTYDVLSNPRSQRKTSEVKAPEVKDLVDPRGDAPVRRNSFTQDPTGSLAGQISGWMARRTSFRKSGKRDSNNKRAGAKTSTGSNASSHSNDSDGGFEEYSRGKASKAEGHEKKKPQWVQKPTAPTPDYSAPPAPTLDLSTMWKPAGRRT